MAELSISVGIILVLLVLIVLACTVFTNAIEWAGHRFELSEGAVGSVLAAVGTALPETIVPIIAILSGILGVSGVSNEAGHDIGIGAILGAPFLLSTLAMFVVAAAVFFFSAVRKRSLSMSLDVSLFRRDFHYFFLAYSIAILASYISEYAVKVVLGIGLLSIYGIYVYRTLKREHIPDEEFDLDPLMFGPKHLEPPTSLILVQVLSGLLGIVLLAHLFVDQINHLSGILNIEPLIISLIIIPIATELPEKFNSVTWIGKRRDNLAMGNITGAMVFQSCIPVTVGLLFTPWQLSFQGLLSTILCMSSSVIIYLYAFQRKQITPFVLLVGGVFYLIFLLYSLSLVLVTHANAT